MNHHTYNNPLVYTYILYTSRNRKIGYYWPISIGKQNEKSTLHPAVKSNKKDFGPKTHLCQRRDDTCFSSRAFRGVYTLVKDTRV